MTTEATIRFVNGKRYTVEVLPDAGPPSGYQPWRRKVARSGSKRAPRESVTEREGLKGPRSEPVLGEWLKDEMFIEDFRGALLEREASRP